MNTVDSVTEVIARVGNAPRNTKLSIGMVAMAMAGLHFVVVWMVSVLAVASVLGGDWIGVGMGVFFGLSISGVIGGCVVKLVREFDDGTDIPKELAVFIGGSSFLIAGFSIYSISGAFSLVSSVEVPLVYVVAVVVGFYVLTPVAVGVVLIAGVE